MIRWILLLLVLGAVLAGLLFPQLYRASEEQRRTMCVQKLHNLSIGVTNYVDVNGEYPPAEGAHGNGVFMFIYPYVESHRWGQQSFATAAGPEFSTWLDPTAEVGSGPTWWSKTEAWRLAQSQDARFICNSVDPKLSAAPLCVSSLHYTEDGTAKLHALRTQAPGMCTYAGVAGANGYTGVEMYGERFGDFLQGVFGGDRNMSPSYVLDGTAQTLGLGEYLGRFDQSQGTWAVRGTWFSVQNASSSRAPSAAEDAHWPYFSGPHPNATLFVDLSGSVRSVAHAIDADVFQALCAIRDGTSVDVDANAPVVEQ